MDRVGLREESSEAVSWEIGLSPPPPPSYSPLFTTECLIVSIERPSLVLAPPPPPLGPTHQPFPSAQLPLGGGNELRLTATARRKCLQASKEKKRASVVPMQIGISCAHTEAPFTGPLLWSSWDTVTLGGPEIEAEAQCFGLLDPPEPAL